MALGDEQTQALSETARRLQVSEADLASAAVRDLVSRQSADAQSSDDLPTPAPARRKDQGR
jgi:hypothetical protein